MSKQTLTLLGFASKAGKLSFGMSAVLESIKKKKPKLILCCSDVSEKTRKEITYYGNKYNLPLKVLDEDMQTVSSAIGRNCGVLSVNDEGFAKSISSQEETK